MAKHMGKMVICKTCGKKIWSRGSGIRGGRIKQFCNQKCYRKSNLYKFKKGHKSTCLDKHSNWKGGNYKDKNGYIHILKPEHPSNNRGYVLEHRLVMEESIKRFLRKDEVIHHKNGICSDNRIENLLLCSQSEHTQKVKGCKLLVIIQARQGSSRLPGKSMLNLNNKPIIGHIIDRLKAVEFLLPGYIDGIVVATTEKKEDDIIEKYCLEKCIRCFRGSESDVLDRFYRCAKQYYARRILRICGDCPFIDPLLIASMIEDGWNQHYIALGVEGGKVPDGMDAEMFTFDMLETAWKFTPAKDREHVTLGIRRLLNAKENCDIGFNTDVFNKFHFSLNDKESLERIKKYAELL